MTKDVGCTQSLQLRIAKHRGKEMIANRRALTYLKVLQMANLLARPVRLLNLPVLIMELKKDGAIKSGPHVIIRLIACVMAQLVFQWCPKKPNRSESASPDD